MMTAVKALLVQDFNCFNMIKRLLFISLVVLFCGVPHAQIDSKQIAGAKVVAQGGYWKSSGTSPNSQEALVSAMQVGCYASLCELELNKDGVWVISSDDNKQKMEDLLLAYKKPLSSDKKSVQGQAKILNAQGKSKRNPMKLILDFNPGFAKESEKSLLPLLRKLMNDEIIHASVELASSNISLCKALAQEFPDVPVSYMKGDLSPRELKKKGFSTGFAVYDCQSLQEHPQWIREAAQSKLLLCVSGVRSEEDVKGLLKVGVQRFLTDEVALVKAWVSKKATVKLMSFNIRMSSMPEVDGDNAWENRKNAVVKMLQSEDPDVFGVQEMLPDQQKYLRGELPEYDMVGVGRDDGMNEGECMGIFYKKNRFELLNNGTFWLSETPEVPSLGWDAACKRTVTYVQLKDRKSGKKFFYFNTHLDHVGMIARQESVKLIVEKIRELVPDTNGAFVLGGDMNAPLTQNIFIPLIGERMKPSDNKLAPAKMQDARDCKDIAPKEAENQRTPSLMRSARNTSWERDYKQTYNGFGKDKPSQIDHVLTSRRVENLVFKTVMEKHDVPYVSDHYPVTLIFTLR